MMMRNVARSGVESNKIKVSFISSLNQPFRGDMQRRDEDSRGMRGAEDENERPHARPTAVLQYTFTTTLVSPRKA